MSFSVIGIDMGLGAFGVAHLEVDDDPDRPRLVEVNCKHTVKATKKERKRVTDDVGDRITELGAFLGYYIAVPDLLVIGLEAPSYSPDASISNKLRLASVFGMVLEASRNRGLRPVQVTPQEVRKAVLGVKGASKEEVQEAMRKLFPDFKGWPTQKNRLPHVADAVAAAWTALRTDEVRSAFRLSQTLRAR